VPDVQRRVTVPLPLERVWTFVADMNNWAAQVPGYRSHTMLSDRQSTWRVAGDVGILTREVDLQVEITDWQAPSRVTFTLEGLDEPVSGEGTFATQPLGTQETTLDFWLSLSAGGPLAPVVNVLLRTQLARVADEFVERLRQRLLVTV
jgi:carbon monoxide dehydrogenase subunit G